MRRLTAVGLAVAVVILAACGVRRHGMIEAPAPDHRAALDCALNEATARGYAPTDGGVDAGYIYLVRRANRGITREEVATRLLTFGLMGHDDVDFDYLSIVGAGGQLRIIASGVTESGKASDPREEALAEAREILAKCARPEG